jgi:hypothetical protein
LAQAIFAARYAALDKVYNPNYPQTRHPNWGECVAIQALARGAESGWGIPKDRGDK